MCIPLIEDYRQEDYRQLAHSIAKGLAEFEFGVDPFATSAMCSRNEQKSLSSRVPVCFALMTES